MNYLDNEYALFKTSKRDYSIHARNIAISVKNSGVIDTLKTSLEHEDPVLANVIAGSATNLHEAYGNGGGMYMLVVAASLKTLRANNPQVAPIGENAWQSALDREQELRERPAISTLELLGGIGMAEIRNVNGGYVDGYEESWQRPGFMSVSGINGLAALHSHDLMHFASQNHS